MRSDTAMVMRASADRKRIDLVSIPRDTIVGVPTCTRADGTIRKAQSGMFNSAFGFDPQHKDFAVAAACTINAVAAITKLPIEDLVVVDLLGFITMVDALGGVQICIPNDIHSLDANSFRLTAGLNTLDGALALDDARARTGKGLDDGSDLGRIPRQQALIAAMAHTVQSKNPLTNGPALPQDLNAATRSITASPDLADLRKLTGLAFGLHGTSAANLTVMTTPIATAPTNKYRVVMAPGATTAPATAPPTVVKTPSKGAITAADVPSACG